MKKLVAIVGMVGAGKTTAARYLQKKGFAYFRFGQIVIDEVKKRKLRGCEKNERTVREELRKKYGMAIIACLSYPKIKNLLKDSCVVGDGLYSWAEYLFLKKRLEEKMITLAIYAKPEVRYQQTKRRGERAISPKTARSRDLADIAHIQKTGPIAMADYTIINEGTIDELKRELDKFLEKFSL